MLEVKQTIATKLKKTILILGMSVCIAGMLSVPSYADAKQIGTFAGHPLFDNPVSDVEITDGGANGIVKRSAPFASKYDPRTNQMVGKRVEDQGYTNTCWAFATIAAIESNLIKKGYEDENVNLSENHLAYFFYNRQTDPVGYTQGDNNLNIGSKDWAMNGGTLYGTALSLTTWAGVVKETASEDDGQGYYSPKVLPAGDCYKSDYRVANTYFYNYSVDTIKQAIMDYGAVASGIYMDEMYFNLRSGAYNCTKAGGNHAVTIVGWDDNYSRNNFIHQPSRNGAWIIKNSYGDYLGDGGYLYVSYEDKSLGEMAAFDMVKASDSYANNYQYDGTANPVAAWSIRNSATFANVFKVKGKQGYNEELKAVSVDVLTTNVRYSLQVYTGVTSGTNPTKGKKVFSTPQTGVLTNAGYNQISLTNPVTLTAGEKYSVVLTLSVSNGQMVAIGAEYNTDADWIRFAANVQTGQGYAYLNNKWYDMGKASDARQITGSTYISNLRIKAYTNDTTQKTSYKLSNKTLGISKGSSAKLAINITPSSVKRKITWSSSDPKVATVDSKGKVKAKAYGKATIKAKFVAGSKTKTLSCKVTVGPSSIKNFKVKGAKKKITVTWKKNSAASGYEVYYSNKKSGKFKALGTVKKNSTTKFTKKKLKQGTYYVKMRPYLLKNGKKLYGSYTAVKTVKVK